MAKRKGEQDDVQKTSLKLPAGMWREVRAAAILQGKTYVIDLDLRSYLDLSP